MRLAAHPESRRLLLALAGAAMLLFVGLVHAPARTAGFVWDDHVLAERDAPFRHGSIAELFVSRFWPDTTLADPRAPYYRPMVLASLRFDAALGGTAAEYHVTNILLHLAACTLLVLIAVRLGATSGSAILAGLLWGVAPRLTESVTWISGRTDVLATVFGLAALVVAPGRSSTGAVRWLRTAATGLLLLTSLLSKELGLAFAGALLLLLWHWSRGEAPRARGLLLLPTVALPVLVYAALRTIALAGGSSGPERELGLLLRTSTVLEAVGRYVEMSLDPLRPRTSIGYIGEVDPMRAALGSVTLCVGVAVLYLQRRRLSLGVVAAIVLGTLALAPVVHIVPLTLSGAVTADRLLYLPLAALAIGAAVGARAFSRRTAKLAACVVFVLAPVFGLATRARAADYRNEVRFWLVAAEHAHSNNTMPRSALAGIVRDSGYPELGCELFETSRRILQESGRGGSVAHRRTGENLAACWAKIGRYEDAARLADEIAREHPDVARVQLGLGFARLHVLDFDGAREAFTRSVSLDPRLQPMVLPALAQLPVAQKETTRFASEDERRRDPFGYAQYLGLVGHLPEAERAYVEVAEDDRQPAVPRRAALKFVVTHGKLESVERAMRAAGSIPFVELTDVSERLPERRASHARVAPYVDRIRALTTGR